MSNIENKIAIPVRLGIVRDEEELAYSRLNILVSNDALAKLDYIKTKSGLASRGRTIQELIDAVWEMSGDVKSIINKLDLQNVDSQGTPDEFLRKISYNIVSLAKNLAKLGLLG